MAIPGSIVGVGKLITPGGQQGPKGDAGTASNVPLADITQNGLLRQNTGNITDFVDGTNNCQPIVPQITSVRLRSYNSIGNPTFECDQRNAGATVANAGGMFMDRWSCGHTGTLVVSTGQLSLPVSIPGTSFVVTRAPMRVTLTTAQASLATGDNLQIVQSVEGANLRELYGDVHSISLLVRSSVTGLNFSVRVSDAPITRSLVKLCTIPAAGVWTLITLPNIPKCPAGNFTYMPGAVGYTFGITLAAGASQIAAAADTWQVTSQAIGAPGMSNFAASPVNSTFEIAFVQHEPGSVCTQLIDKPFSQSLDECLRYYQKSYDYAVSTGTVTNAGIAVFLSRSVASADGTVFFPKHMAKTPSLVLYDHGNGAANSVMDAGSVHHLSAAAQWLGSKGFTGMAFTTATTVNPTPVWCHYSADTGW